ncbi:hypothetical protein B5X24_HaOG205778 [Helicoverpa armigera]|uniref:Uncharacterized protein n=1 Tax=Helicoverpa armigera TaxID=29058 RepID=A0A2W1BN23_HELAM|nr:hypothetical protein B5X24_HaOG205778 [Helicoverpa armigera]
MEKSNMLIRCGLLLLCLNCVRTTEYFGSDGLAGGRVAEFNRRFSLWPSVHNAARLLRVRREAEASSGLQSEGGNVEVPKDDKSPKPGDSQPAPAADVKSKDGTNKVKDEPVTTPPVNGTATANSTVVPQVAVNATSANTTVAEKPVKQIDLNNPGVLKRGFIVFGGFTLLAVAYFIFYRKKSKKNETGNTHSTIDANQFRYGVLQSEDRRDNLELSRVPLTMESDDDEDEDLEIFDLEQKKKSLSYVNLQTNDEDVVFSPKDSTDNDRDNLLLDIEDGTSDTLINWSSNGSKSIL